MYILYGMQGANDYARSADILHFPTGTRQFSSLAPIQPHGSTAPLFWVHGDYSDIVLRRRLPADQPVYGLLHQARDGTPAKYATVETIAAHYLEEIQAVQSRGPYLLGGYSFGGTVAFEIAQQLRRRGDDVGLLFVIDSQFPGQETADASGYADSRAAVRAKIRRHVDEVSALPAGNVLEYMQVRTAERIRQVGHTFTRLGRRLACRGHLLLGRRIPLSLRSFYMLQIYRNARRTYVVQPYAGDMVYIQCAERANGDAGRWRGVVSGTMQVCDVPSDHMAILREPAAAVWIDVLKTRLDALRAPARGARRESVPQ